jgi:cytidine deaminase
MPDDFLLEAARAVQLHAYAPYSGFRVGAALEGMDGQVFVGCNVESASFGLTICAERSALVAAVAAGHRAFRRIVVISDSDPPASPCGACRQMLAEFGLDLRVDAVGPGRAQTWTLAELLPDAFTSHRLEAP